MTEPYSDARNQGTSERVDAVFERSQEQLTKISVNVALAFADAQPWLRGTVQTLLTEADRHPELTEAERIASVGDILADRFYSDASYNEHTRK